jgi:hypothetical protein
MVMFHSYVSLPEGIQTKPMFGFQPIKSSGFSSLLFKQRALVGTVIGDNSLLLFWKQKCGQEFIYLSCGQKNMYKD